MPTTQSDDNGNHKSGKSEKRNSCAPGTHRFPLAPAGVTGKCQDCGMTMAAARAMG